MVIKPVNAPELFVKLFGEVYQDSPDLLKVGLQRNRAMAWDAAIDHILLQKPIQRKTPLTHPVN